MCVFVSFVRPSVRLEGLNMLFRKVFISRIEGMLPCRLIW